jgi:hypothetical protein
MPEEDRPSQSLCAEDYIILTVIIICLVGPILMLGAWQIYSIYFPPALIAIFLGISVASLLYRFLGGIHDATFAVGALKVTGSAAVLAGIAWWSNMEINKQVEAFSDKKKDSTEFVATKQKLKKAEEQIIELKKDNSTVLSDKSDLNIKLSKLQDELEQLKNEEKIIDLVKSLDPEDKISYQLRKVALAKEGAWGDFSKQKQLTVSVVSYLKEGQIAACPEYYGKKIELVSEFTQFNENIRATSPITITVNKYITRAINCSNERDYDLQINCPDAIRIFTNKLLVCTDNEVKWKIEKNKRKLLVSAIILVNGDS